MEKLIIDGTNAKMGRLASYVAKQALLGKEVVVLNCKEIQITGSKRQIISSYLEKIGKGGASNYGPHFPRSAERIMKRTIRGMLSHRMGRGEAALKRVKCYNDTPKEYADSPKIKTEKSMSIKAIKLSELTREFL